MTMANITNWPDCETLATVIARSPIVFVEQAACLGRLPAGFDDIDIAILDWIAAEGRRIGRGYFTL